MLAASCSLTVAVLGNTAAPPQLMTPALAAAAMQSKYPAWVRQYFFPNTTAVEAAAMAADSEVRPILSCSDVNDPCDVKGHIM